MGSCLRYEAHEEGRRTYQPKYCDNNDEDKVTSPNILSYKKVYEIILQYFKNKYLRGHQTLANTTQGVSGMKLL